MTPLQRRILLELSGCGRDVAVRDLCDALGIEYAAFDHAETDLLLGGMINYHPNISERQNPSYSITWIGERCLTDHPARTRRPRRKLWRR